MAPKKARDRKRQTKISFSPAAKSSPSTRASATATATLGKAPVEAPRKKPSIYQSTRSAKTKQSESTSEDELAAETDRSMKLGLLGKSKSNSMFGGSEVDSATSQSSEEEKQAQTKSVTRKRQRPTSSSDNEEVELAVTVIPRKRQRRKEVQVESSEEEEEVPKACRKRRVTRRHSTPEEEVEIHTPPPSTRRRLTKRRSPSLEVEEDEELTLPRRRRHGKEPSPSEEDIEMPTSPKSTWRRATRQVSASADEDQEELNDFESDKDDGEERVDLKEDLAFLRSSPLPDRGRLRSTHEKPKNERQKALEALKRRRAGTNEPSSSATPSRKKPIIMESDSDSELEVIKEENEDSEAQILDPIGDDDEDDEDEQESDRDANALDMFQEDVEDEGFVVDDDEAVIGEPSATADLDELRLLAGLSRAKSKDLFKHAVEWMVMKKIHPAFDSTKNVYTLTFRKLDDEVKGLAGSKFTSSAWTPDFTRSIRARPDLMIDDISAAMRAVMSAHCEACNRSNHTASFELMLTGKPYNAETLEPLDTNDDSDDSDSSDTDSSLSADSEHLLNREKPAYNADGERLPPEHHRFALGSTCKANAQVAHTLHHWRYHLYQWVKAYLAQQGHLTAEKLVKRDKWSDRKREKAAIKIVDGMERDGEVRKLFKLYKDQVEFAIEASNEYKNGWGRR